MLPWVWILLGVIVVALVIAATMIKTLGGKKQAGETVGWLDVALAFAQGIDDAKDLLPADAKKKMTGALADAATAAGKHGDVKAFLTRFGFNQPKPSASDRPGR